MALFTVEQIELIRRLRSSGITREQVLLAFTELERLDAEFGRSFSYGERCPNHNMEFSFSTTSVVRSSCSASNDSSVPIASTNVSNVNDSALHVPFKPNEYFRSPSATQCRNPSTCEELIDPSILNGDCSVNPTDMPSRVENELALPCVNDAAPIVSSSESLSQNAYNSSFNCSFYPMDVQSEELAELHELKKIEKSITGDLKRKCSLSVYAPNECTSHSKTQCNHS
ncbi:hypothetical protein X975_09550, partial [Stegodyphus mimosarum]